MQRSVLRPGYLTQTLQSATCRHWHVHSLSSLPARNHGSHRRPLRAWFPVQARKGLSELLSLSDKPASSAGTLLIPHKVSPRLAVPPEIGRPPYVDTGQAPWSDEPEIHDQEGVERMRASGRLAADVLAYAGTLVKAGVTTDEIDKAVHKMTIDNGAYPSPLTYGNFPKSVCTSVNECVCHGIPDARKLVEGDIVNIDVTVYLNGYHGDTSRMFTVGRVSDKARQLCAVTLEALEAAVALCGPGVPVRKIGEVVERIAQRHKYGIVKDFVGHGVGKVFHASPLVHHTRNMERGTMQVGQTFTIEPILTTGGTAWKMWKDDWTVVTKDASLAAQYEHTVLITEAGHDILTTWPERR
ncbi:Methionine aminopeptidase 1D, chloroplastic/mitochondrial [Coccomyxa viridis]|uniref:Methionine aminopeptidase n=1 Tax=Coccomyxa viridis TaxID=1274662 RepID=A0AAV1I0R9_9CHLO|nr:Methionine aminopeptidase 1D, chloroplastic/mitochondrial [Coccomyxa viridis]